MSGRKSQSQPTNQTIHLCVGFVIGMLGLSIHPTYLLIISGNHMHKIGGKENITITNTLTASPVRIAKAI